MYNRDFKRAYDKVIDKHGNVRNCSIRDKIGLVAEYNKTTNNKLIPGSIPSQADLIEIRSQYNRMYF